MTDRVEIGDLRVLGVHGVLPEERERAQPFSVDIVAWVDTEAAQQSDDLADTVDYGSPGPVGGRRGERALVPAAGGPGRPDGHALSSSTPGSRRWR